MYIFIRHKLKGGLIVGNAKSNFINYSSVALNRLCLLATNLATCYHYNSRQPLSTLRKKLKTLKLPHLLLSHCIYAALLHARKFLKLLQVVNNKTDRQLVA